MSALSQDSRTEELHRMADQAVIPILPLQADNLGATPQENAALMQRIGAEVKVVPGYDGEKMAYLPVRGLVNIFVELSRYSAGPALMARIMSAVYHGGISQLACRDVASAVTIMGKAKTPADESDGRLALRTLAGSAILLWAVRERGLALPETQEVADLGKVLAADHLYDTTSGQANLDKVSEVGRILSLPRRFADVR